VVVGTGDVAAFTEQFDLAVGVAHILWPEHDDDVVLRQSRPVGMEAGVHAPAGVAQLLDYLGIGVGEGGCRQVGDAHLTAKRRFPLVITRRMPEERFDNPQFEARDDLVCGIDDLRPR